MKLSNKRVLVTGGAGFIGSNLVDALIANGNEVIVLDDLSTGREDNLAQAASSGRLRLIRGSILDDAALRAALKDAQVVFHLAVKCLRACFGQPELVHHVNATGTLKVLEQSQQSGTVERFIYVSSSEVYGSAQCVPMSEQHPLEPTTVYGGSKLAGELYTQAMHITNGFPTIILRPFNTYGYREHHEGTSGEVIPRFCVRLLNNLPPIIYGNGTQTRDFTFVTDTVRGIMAASEYDGFVGEKVNIAFGVEVSIRAIAHSLMNLLNLTDLDAVFQESRPADVNRHFADITKLVSQTGFTPTVSIDEGLRLYVEWFRSEHGKPSELLDQCNDRNWLMPEGKTKYALADRVESR